MSKPKTIVTKKPGTLIPEVIKKPDARAQDWHTARQMLQAVHTHGRLFLLGQILLGWQLQTLKKSLGFDARGGDRKSKCQSGTLIESWEATLEKELKIPKRTAYRFEQIYQGAKAKLKRLGGSSKALTLLQRSPQNITESDHQLLQKQLTKAICGDTQKDLLIELKIAKAPQGSAVVGGNKNGQRKASPTMQQLAFVLFGEAEQTILNLRDHTDFKKSLHALPLSSDDDQTPSLNSLEISTESLLKDIQKAKTKAQNKIRKDISPECPTPSTKKS